MTAHIIRLRIAKLASIILIVGCFLALSEQSALATAGINRTINFQGKVVNKTTGLNVADGNYDFTFKLYNVSSAGSVIWTENWTAAGGGQLAVTNGIFRVALGSFTTFASANVDFNNDSLYLDITFNGETMGTRVQLTAVPYALNAEKVAGLTVTNNGGNTLNIAASKTLTVNNTITFGGTDSTSFTLPSSTDTLVGLAATQTLTNKTIGSTGLTFSGATTDITTGTNESLAIMPNGTGNVGIGTTTTAGLVTIGNSGRTPTGKALLVLDQYETNGDLFTASVSGTKKFVLSNTGDIISVAGAKWMPLTNSTTALNIANAAGTSFVNFNSTYSTMRVGTTFSVYTTGNEGALHIGGSGSSKGTILENTSATVLDLWSDANGGSEYSFGLGSLVSQDFALSDGNGGTRMYITGGGTDNPKVGFGHNNTSPNGVLDVNGRAIGKALAIFNQSSGTQNIFVASQAGVAKFVIASDGNVGIGTTLPGSKLDVEFASAPTTDMMNINNSSTGTTTTAVDGLQVDFATAGTTASADNAGLRVNVTSGNSGTTTTLEGIYIGNLSGAQSNSTETGLKIGTGWDSGISVASGGITVSGGGLTLSGASGLAYSGSARPTKTLVLSAEYPGAVLTASSSATVNGSMTSDASPSATFGAGTNNWMNYYQWTSTQASLQDYTVAVRVTVPKDFSAWNSTAIQVNYNTQLTLTASNKLDVLIYRAANATASPLSMSLANASTTAKTWKTVDIPSSDLSTLAAGDTFVLYLKMYAKDSNYVQIGDISLSYLAAF